MPITKLNLDGAATKAELDRIQAQGDSAVDVDITADGVEAEVSTTKKGWAIAAYIRRKWNGETTAGGRIRRTL